MTDVHLPALRQHRSPNLSDRLHGITPYLVVVHRPAGPFAVAERILTDDKRPAAKRVSAHVLTDSNREAVQLVPWDRKAWSCCSFNSVSYNVEVDDDAWNGNDPDALATAARLVAFICHKTGIPPTWTRQPTHVPGVTRHYDLGAAGGGHTDPTTSDAYWRHFIAKVHAEVERGGFRQRYGVGRFHRI